MFKPLDMTPAALHWQADVLSSVVPDGFRVAAPLHTRDGELVVDGWTAWPALAGAQSKRWPEIVAVGERFHRAVARVPRPHALLNARHDRWARADRVAWDESPAGDLRQLPEIAALLGARAEVGAGSQLIHGDLTGNVLFADGLPPAIIDVSPYWRPAMYASAIVMVDAVLWHAADPSLLATVPQCPDGAQLLLRAALFRLLSESDPASAALTYRPVVDRILHCCES